jgi:hypothetical protein
LLLCKMMWLMMLEGYLHDMSSLDADVDILYVKRMTQ